MVGQPVGVEISALGTAAESFKECHVRLGVLPRTTLMYG